LDEEHDFDLVHHVTVSSYWTRVGVRSVAKPLIWGPVGGGVDPPLQLLPALGPRGIIEAAARIVARPVIALLPPIRRSHQNVTIAFAQNQNTARRIKGTERVRVLPNALTVDLGGMFEEEERTHDLLFAGRLVAWKGPMLALRALRLLRDREAILHYCGIGPERARLERAARRWGLVERVRFEGYLPREELLGLLATAGALVHPALNEEAGLSVAEALSLGTPVVCLDHGGPSELVRCWPESPSALIKPASPKATAAAVAAAVDGFLKSPPLVRRVAATAVMSYEDEVLGAYEVAAGVVGGSESA
jgi:glycosyltransferase involved in cell wall biosynthesis